MHDDTPLLVVCNAYPVFVDLVRSAVDDHGVQTVVGRPPFDGEERFDVLLLAGNEIGRRDVDARRWPSRIAGGAAIVYLGRRLPDPLRGCRCTVDLVRPDIPAGRLVATIVGHAADGGADCPGPGSAVHLERLTPRQRDVLGDLMRGLSPRDIAEHDTLALSTVRSHIRSILRRLDVQSATEAVAAAWRTAGHPDLLPPGD